MDWVVIFNFLSTPEIYSEWGQIRACLLHYSDASSEPKICLQYISFVKKVLTPGFITYWDENNGVYNSFSVFHNRTQIFTMSQEFWQIVFARALLNCIRRWGRFAHARNRDHATLIVYKSIPSTPTHVRYLVGTIIPPPTTHHLSMLFGGRFSVGVFAWWAGNELCWT